MNLNEFEKMYLFGLYRKAKVIIMEKGKYPTAFEPKPMQALDYEACQIMVEGNYYPVDNVRLVIIPFAVASIASSSVNKYIRESMTEIRTKQEKKSICHGHDYQLLLNLGVETNLFFKPKHPGNNCSVFDFNIAVPDRMYLAELGSKSFEDDIVFKSWLTEILRSRNISLYNVEDFIFIIENLVKLGEENYVIK